MSAIPVEPFITILGYTFVVENKYGYFSPNLLNEFNQLIMQLFLTIMPINPCILQQILRKLLFLTYRLSLLGVPILNEHTPPVLIPILIIVISSLSFAIQILKRNKLVYEHVALD